MSDSEKSVAYGVSADPSAFEAGMRKAADSAKTAASDIDSHFKKVQDTFANVQKYLLGLTAVIAGGGAFKALISSAADWNGEAGKLAKTLGITTEQASVLNVALDHLGIDSETYIGASQKMSKQIFSNADAFKQLGVAVRDTTTGAYRPVTEVMTEVNQKLAEIKNPIEQNIAGMQVYGKSWAEVKSIVKVTGDQLEEAERTARKLGLVVGPEGVAAAKQYKEEMRDLKLVGHSLEIQFGNALLPIFKETGKFMADEGPAAGQAFALILRSVAFAAAATWLAFKDMGDGLAAIAAQAAALLHGDLDGFAAIGKARDEEAAKNEAAFEKMKSGFFDQKPPEPPKPPDLSSGPQYHFKEKNAKDTPEKSKTSEWDAQLAEEKLHFQERMNLEGSFAQFGKQAEIKFWQDKLALTEQGSADNISVRRKLADLQLSIGQDAYQKELANLQTQEAAYKNNTEAKLAILAREADLVKQRFGIESKEYEAVQKQIVEAKRQAVEQIKQIDLMRTQGARDAQLAELQDEQQMLQLQRDMGVVSQQDVLNKQIAFEDKKNAISKQALMDRLTEASGDDQNPAEVEKAFQDIEALERQHQQRLGEIRMASFKESQKYMMGAVDAMGSGFQSVFQQILQGTMSTQKAMQAMWQALTQAVTGALAKIGADMLIEAAKNLLFGKAVAVSKIAALSAEAGAGGVASMAAAPFPLNMGALAFGAEMSAAAMSFAPMASAAGGFDIPGTLNPITQLHAREMVLPAKHADVIRSMADQGQDGQAAAGGDVHIHINATDSQSVARLFRDNGIHLVAALQQQRRNLAF